jgi:hypothetical protein
MWFKDGLEELKYLRSANNTTSRGFYMMISIMMLVSLIMLPASVILAVAGVTSGTAAVMSIAISTLVLLLSWGVFIYMVKKG